MNIHRRQVIDQNSQYIKNLAHKNGTNIGTCGFITLAICDYLSKLKQFNKNTILQLNQQLLTPYIQKAMCLILKARRFTIKKYLTKMNENQRKQYISNCVANFQLSDYLESISQQMHNKHVYFFRQVAYDHPGMIQGMQFQEKQRIQQQEIFKGEQYYYTSFNPIKHHLKENFGDQLKKLHKQNDQPIIIATDVLGHFHTTILFKGEVFILDTLTSTEFNFENGIIQTIKFMYKNSLKQHQNVFKQ